ncbi:tetratricopeptide repeat protein [Risungbinella massiliensis]|uniref:tetratricopeptide repeat protein n=1 Tax=Risungbinella massiliensis TaxID=1329796 RepID=UPI0005CC1C58|nr:tetratricopeptide repeat protein [Risungbinella massiliensis]
MAKYHYITPTMGDRLKQARIELGLSIEKLSDDMLSTGTISNLERGNRNVSQEKLRYLCTKVNLIYEELISLEEEPQKLTSELIDLELLMIEQELDTRSDEAWKRLQALDGTHPKVSYLKGKYFSKRRLWNNAESYFRNAIEYSKSSNISSKDNILALSYYELSRNAYYESKLAKALLFIEEGIRAFQEDGEKQFVYYYLLTSQVIYLKKMNRTMEAFKRLEDLKPLKNKVETTTILLSLIDLEAGLLNDLGYYREAIKEATYGLELARLDRRHERSVELYSTLGTSWMHLEQWNLAESCFTEAIKAEDARDDLLVVPYKKLGEMFQRQGNLEAALKYLEKAKNLALSANDHGSYCEVCVLIGTLYEMKNDVDASLVAFNEAIDISTKLNLNDLQFKATKNYLNVAKTHKRSPNEIIETLSKSLLEYNQKEDTDMYQNFETDPPEA